MTKNRGLGWDLRPWGRIKHGNLAMGVANLTGIGISPMNVLKSVEEK
jgi:hypothetical protein